jgi:hypothetical protein
MKTDPAFRFRRSWRHQLANRLEDDLELGVEAFL